MSPDLAALGCDLGLWPSSEAARHSVKSASVEMHPLGMYAWRAPHERGEVRFHLWDSSSFEFRDELSTIHDHIWHLRSTLIHGQITNTTFSVGSHGPHSISVRDYSTGSIRLLTDHASLIVRSSQDIEAGRSYELPPGMLHQTAIRSQRVLTGLLATHTPATKARIVGHRGETSAKGRRTVQVGLFLELIDRCL